MIYASLILGGVIICFFIRILDGTVPPAQKGTAAIIIGIAFLIAMVLLAIRQIGKKKSIDLRRVDICERLIRSLSVDMKPQAPMQVGFDFRSHHTGEFQKKTAPGSLKASETLITCRIPWLQLSATLLDRQRITINLSQTVTTRDTRKRKYTKRVEAFRERLKVTARVNPASYPRLSEIKMRALAARIRGPFQHLDWQVKENKVSVVADLPKAKRVFGRNSRNKIEAPSELLMQEKQVLDVIVALYQALGHCRAPSGGKKSGTGPGANHGR
jgi:hypothetical protein